MGFHCPIGAWLRGPLGDAVLTLRRSTPPLWDEKAEDELWDEHLTGRGDWGQQLWRLAVLRKWLEGHAAV